MTNIVFFVTAVLVRLVVISYLRLTVRRSLVIRGKIYTLCFQGLQGPAFKLHGYGIT